MKLSTGEISTCSTCGSAVEETSNGDLGCMVCLLRVGISGEDRIGDSTDGRFGIYVIERHDDGSLHELGRGAMGVTFCAIDTSLQRKVALKIIKTDLAARSAEARERFMREARAAAALRHENVATVYQFGVREETGQCFYAMERVEGETLEERVRRTGPLDVWTTIAIGQQVAAALCAAEKRGLVHRDLKPANLMLVAADDEGGTQDRHRENAMPLVKIIDFGLAKALNTETDPMSLTRDGFVGTPAFASPEQFRNAPLDVRSDVYSLGLTLWFALTGKTPFHGSNVEEIQRAQQSGALPIDQLKAARVPSRLISLLESMSALEPAARPSVNALAARLRRCAASMKLQRRRFALVLVAVTVLLIGIAISVVKQSSRGREVGGTANPAAREAYLRGMYIWNKRNWREYPQAEQYFKRAISLDPKYAQAYAGLSDLFQFMSGDKQVRAQLFADARSAARKALELEPRLPEGHAALGLIAMNYDWDWPRAEKEFRRAIALNPNYSVAHHWYAEWLAVQGRFDESLREIETALHLDPTSMVIPGDTGKYLIFARRFEQAQEKLKESLTLDPKWGRSWLAFAYAKTGQFEKAFAELREMERIDTSGWTSGLAAYVYGLANNRAQAEKMLAQTEERLDASNDLLPLAYAYIALGDNERAMSCLERDCDAHATSMTPLKVFPLYDPLRSDPRFLDLMRRVHLAP